MTMEIKMLRAIADAATQMAEAMQAVVADCEEQLAKRKAAGETEEKVWAEPYEYLGKKPAGAPDTPAPDAELPLTIVELRAFVAEKSTPENRPAIKEILTQHGVKKLTELKENQYRSVMEAVRKVCK